MRVDGITDVEALALQQLNTFALLDEAVARYRRLYERGLRAQRLTLTEYAMLARVRAFGEVRQGLLAERLRLSRQRVHQLVRRLERRGSVLTRSDPRRVDVRIVLTPAGRAQLDTAQRGLRSIRDGVFSRFGVQQESTMRFLLEDLIEAVKLWHCALHWKEEASDGAGASREGPMAPR